MSTKSTNGRCCGIPCNQQVRHAIPLLAACALIALYVFALKHLYVLPKDDVVTTTEPAPARKPNIIYIFADDYGFNDIGYHGREHGSVIQTPIMDVLSAEGVRLENYYVQPTCTPSRSQFLSGRYQIHTGLQHAAIDAVQPYCLPIDEVTIPEKLREVGYSTHMVGKWHVGFYKRECMPNKRGFDSFFGYVNAGEDYYDHDSSVNVYGKTFDGYDFYEDMNPAKQYEGMYSTSLFTRKTQDLILNYDKEQPLFIYLAYQAVHGRAAVPDKYMEQYENITDETRRTYAGMVTCMDEGLGNITDALKEAGLYDNTIIVFSSDNGGSTDTGASNWPLRGNKTTLWEGGIRAVGFVHSPLLPDSAKGTTNEDLLHVSDWFPTIVAGMAGGNLNGTKPLDGYDVWDSIRGFRPSPRQEILHNIDPMLIAPLTYVDTTPGINGWTTDLVKTLTSVEHYANFSSLMQAALRVGDWKIVTGTGESSCRNPPNSMGILPECLKKKRNQTVWLFNITADPLEEFDLSDMYPEVVDRMLNRLNEYYLDSVPVLYPMPDTRSNPRWHDGDWIYWT